MLDFIVMQMSKGNRENGYYSWNRTILNSPIYETEIYKTQII